MTARNSINSSWLETSKEPLLRPEEREGHVDPPNTTTPEQGNTDVTILPSGTNRIEYEEAAVYVKEGESNNKFDIHPEGKWSKRAFRTVHRTAYHVYHLCVCTLILLLVLIERPSLATHADLHQSYLTTIVVVHALLELTLLALIWIDIILQFLWFGLNRSGIKHFFTHRTAVILFVLVVMSLEAVVVIVRQENHFRVTRALRPIFLLDTYYMGEVRRVLRQIFECFKPILEVLILMMLMLVIFSLLGFMFFAETDVTYFVTFSRSLVSFFITMTTANHPNVLMEAYIRQPLSPIFFVIYIIITAYFINNILLATVYHSFREGDKKKFKSLFLHKRAALRKAFDKLKTHTPVAGDGIRFKDFLLFMHHYRPRVADWQVMCMFKALHKNLGEPQQGEPQQGEPQQGEPQQREPQQREPQQGEPQQREPQQGEPQQSEPQQGEPQQREPQQGEPQQGEPQQSEPQQGEPQQGEPQQREPQQGEPQQREPQQGEPQQREPQQSEPQQSEPQQREPQQSEPQQSEPQQSEPQQREPQQPQQGEPQQPEQRSLEEFYEFYEVRDYKWEVTVDGKELMWFEHNKHCPDVMRDLARVMYALVKSRWFNMAINIVMTVNLIILVVYTLLITEEEVESRYLILNKKVAVSLAFVCIYMVEIWLRAFAKGPHYYFRKPRNLLDGLVIHISFILLIVEASSPLYSFLAAARPFKFFRLLKLKRRYRDIMRTLFVLSHRLLSAIILLVLIYYFFAIIGLEFFSDAVYENCCNESWYDIGTFYSGNNQTFTPNVYYLLDFDDIFHSYLTLFVLMVVNNWYIIMEGFASTTDNSWLARLYFMAFFISTLIVLQVIVSFIVDSFEIGMKVIEKDRHQLRDQHKQCDCQPRDQHKQCKCPNFKEECVKSRKYKETAEVELTAQDVQTLKDEIVSNEETVTSTHNKLSRFIRQKKNKSLLKWIKNEEGEEEHPEKNYTFSGRRQRTKDDIHSNMYKDEKMKWIKNEEGEEEHPEKNYKYTFSGRRQRTKDDTHLNMYKDEKMKWIKNEEGEEEHECTGCDKSILTKLVKLMDEFVEFFI